MQTGLVLEGGAMRGMFTAGVLDRMMDENIKFDSIIGVSAGALFGVNYLSNQKGRVIRYNKRFNSDKKYMGIGSLIKTGNIVNTEYAYDIVPKKYDLFDDDTFKASGVPYFAGVTNIETGKAEYIRINSVFDQMDVLRASASMPFVSKPVLLDGKYYLDGGVADSIPYKKMMELGVQKTVVVLTREAEYVKPPMKKTFAKIMYRKYPNFLKTLLSRYEDYNNCSDEIKQLEKEGRVFVIRPPKPITIAKLERDPEKLQSVYDMGVKTASEIMPRLLAYLASEV